MLVFPNIKINLGLFVTGKRPDGFHNIESIFYPVGWRESLEIVDRAAVEDEHRQWNSRVESGRVRFYSYGIPIPGDPGQNLCIRVFHLLEAWFNLPPVDMHLLKAIPAGAGLGGGSADAACCLRALRDFFHLRISDHEAMELLAGIGSDCPFFWKNRPMFVFGRGEQMRPADLDLSSYHILLVYPSLAVSTKEAYAGVSPKAPPIDLNLIGSLPVEHWREVVHNDFETSLFPAYPQLAAIKEQLYDLGAAYASMSGSGSTLYGIFKDKPTVPEKWSGYVTWMGEL